MKTLQQAWALALPLVLTGGCIVSVDSQAQMAREEKRFAVSGTPVVRLTTFDGSIEIKSWDRPEVLVEIEKRGPTREAIESLEVKSSQDGSTIEVDVQRPGGQRIIGIGLGSSASARLIVSVPRKADIRARSGDGAIQIARVDGRLELHTGDGSIRASELSGELSLTTGDGSITVDGAEGRLQLQTGDGSVNVTGNLGVVRLHTGDGAIVYRSERGSAMAGDWEITTGDGAVSLYLPPDFGAELDAHTGDGSIGNDLAVTSADSPGEDRRSVKGRLGSGGKRLRIRTGDGSIRLRSL